MHQLFILFFPQIIVNQKSDVYRRYGSESFQVSYFLNIIIGFKKAYIVVSLTDFRIKNCGTTRSGNKLIFSQLKLKWIGKRKK